MNTEEIILISDDGVLRVSRSVNNIAMKEIILDICISVIMMICDANNGFDKYVLKDSNYLKDIKKDKIIIIATHIKDDLIDFVDEIYEFDAGNVKKIDK